MYFNVLFSTYYKNCTFPPLKSVRDGFSWQIGVHFLLIERSDQCAQTLADIAHLKCIYFSNQILILLPIQNHLKAQKKMVFEKLFSHCRFRNIEIHKLKNFEIRVSAKLDSFRPFTQIRLSSLPCSMNGWFERCFHVLLLWQHASKLH